MPPEAPNNYHNLLEQIARGDEKAFAILFHQHSDKLGGFLLQLTRSEHMAREIVLSVFLKIWKNRLQLPEVTDFDNYLFIVTRNAAFDALRQRAAERKRRQQMTGTGTLQTADADHALQLHRLQQLHQEAVNRLSSRQKDIYLLSREAGLTHRQIAEQTGLAIETVKKHMTLALQSVRQFIRTHYELPALAIFSLAI